MGRDEKILNIGDSVWTKALDGVEGGVQECKVRHVTKVRGLFCYFVSYKSWYFGGLATYAFGNHDIGQHMFLSKEELEEYERVEGMFWAINDRISRYEFPNTAV